MKKEEKDNLIYFGEWVPYKEGDKKSKAKARNYLKQWKSYILAKCRYELYNYEPFDGQIVDGEKMRQDPEGWYEHWFEQPAWAMGLMSSEARLGLKFCLKKKLPNQIN